MNKSKLIYLIFCLILVVLIFWRYNIVLFNLNDGELSNEFVGRVVAEPDVRENNVKLTIKTDKAKVLVTIGRYPEYKYGDELRIVGELQDPIVFEDFNYKNYLLKDGITSVVYYPKVELLSNGQGFYSWIFSFKDKIRQNIYKVMSPPQSEILGAMILGDKNRMSLELKEKLNIAGVRHITAISGLHIFILSTILMSLLLGLGLWRNQAFYISIIIIFLFIAMIGFQPSSVRAGIMASLFLIAQKLGRMSVSSRAIVITGGVMLIINPLLLFYDVGFQLSFLAALGIIYLSSFFRGVLDFIRLKYLKDILVITFSAYVFTLPVLIYSFGRISLIGPVANVLIIPVVYWIMILGFAFSLIGLVWPFLAWLISFPIWLLLTYIIKVVDMFSKSWAAKTIDDVHWFWLIIFYLFLFILIRYFKNRKYKV